MSDEQHSPPVPPCLSFIEVGVMAIDGLPETYVYVMSNIQVQAFTQISNSYVVRKYFSF